jgi:hypothetical protein
MQAFSHLAESNPGLHQLGYRDKAWAVNKLGMVATGHGLPDTCLSVLNTMYGYGAMEVQEVRRTARHGPEGCAVVACVTQYCVVAWMGETWPLLAVLSFTQ